MAVSKRLRYEILRRDNHACRYCGATAPDVKLTVDHVTPVTLGGTDEPGNLAAACTPCNSGKSSVQPDGPLVTDVDQDAIRWARARGLAAAKKLHTAMDLVIDVSNVIGMFEDEHKSTYGESPPIPADAEDAVERWITLGVPAGLMGMLATKVGRKDPSTIRWDKRWNYFAGCCWNALRDIESNARTLIADGAV